MTDDQKTIALRQLANAVIDAYLTRDQQFKPEFKSGVRAVLYLERPHEDRDHPGLRTDVWYDRADYEPMGSDSEQKTKRTAKN